MLGLLGSGLMGLQVGGDGRLDSLLGVEAALAAALTMASWKLLIVFIAGCKVNMMQYDTIVNTTKFLFLYFQ